MCARRPWPSVASSLSLCYPVWPGMLLPGQAGLRVASGASSGFASRLLPGSTFSALAVHRMAFACNWPALPTRLLSASVHPECFCVLRRGAGAGPRPRAQPRLFIVLLPSSTPPPTLARPLPWLTLSWADRNLPSPGTPVVFLAEWILAPLEGWPQKVRRE